MNDMSDIPQDLLTQSIAGRRLDNKCIILTGAAGSIGSYITGSYCAKARGSC